MHNKARKKGMRTSIKVHHNLLSPSYTHVLSITNMLKKNNTIFLGIYFLFALNITSFHVMSVIVFFFLLKGNMVRVKEMIHIQNPLNSLIFFQNLTWEIKMRKGFERKIVMMCAYILLEHVIDFIDSSGYEEGGKGVILFQTNWLVKLT